MSINKVHKVLTPFVVVAMVLVLSLCSIILPTLSSSSSANNSANALTQADLDAVNNLSSIYQQPYGNDGWMWEAMKGSGGKDINAWAGYTPNGQNANGFTNGVINRNGNSGTNGLTDNTTSIAFGSRGMPMGVNGTLGNNPADNFKSTSSSALWKVLAVGDIPAQNTTKGFPGTDFNTSAKNYGVSTPLNKNEALLVMNESPGVSIFNVVSPNSTQNNQICDSSGVAYCRNDYQNSTFHNNMSSFAQKYFSSNELSALSNRTINGVCSLTSGCYGTHGRQGAATSDSNPSRSTTSNTGITASAEKIFPLSYGDVAGSPQTVNGNKPDEAKGLFFDKLSAQIASSTTRLRSPYADSENKIWAIKDNGNIEGDATNTANGVRPSLRLNLDKLLLSSGSYQKRLTLLNDSVTGSSFTVNQKSLTALTSPNSTSSDASANNFSVNPSNSIDIVLNDAGSNGAKFDNVGYKIVDPISKTVVGYGEGEANNRKVSFQPVCNYLSISNILATDICSTDDIPASNIASANNKAINSGETYKSLLPLKDYLVYVWPQFSGGCTDNITVSCSNEGGIPAVFNIHTGYGEVNNFNATAGDSRVLLEWDTPDYPEHQYLGSDEYRPFDAYEISCSGDFATDSIVLQRGSVGGQLNDGSDADHKVHYSFLCGKATDISENSSSRFYADSISSNISGVKLYSGASLTNNQTFYPKVRVVSNGVNTIYGAVASTKVIPNVISSIAPDYGPRAGGNTLVIEGDFEKLGATTLVTGANPNSQRISQSVTPDKVVFTNSNNLQNSYTYTGFVSSLNSIVLDVEDCKTINSNNDCLSDVVANISVVASNASVTDVNISGYTTTGDNRKVTQNNAYSYRSFGASFFNSDYSDLSTAKAISITHVNQNNQTISLSAALCLYQNTTNSYSLCDADNDVVITMKSVDNSNIDLSFNVKTTDNGLIDCILSNTLIPQGRYSISLYYGGTVTIPPVLQTLEINTSSNVPVIKILNTQRSVSNASVTYNLSKDAHVYAYFWSTCITNQDIIKTSGISLGNVLAQNNINYTFNTPDQNSGCISFLAQDNDGNYSSFNVTESNIPYRMVDGYNKLLNANADGSLSAGTSEITLQFEYSIDLNLSNISITKAQSETEDIDVIISSVTSDSSKKNWKLSVDYISKTGNVELTVDKSLLFIEDGVKSFTVYKVDTGSIMTISNLVLTRMADGMAEMSFNSNTTGIVYACIAQYYESTCNTFVSTSIPASVGLNQINISQNSFVSLFPLFPLYSTKNISVKVVDGSVQSNIIHNSLKGWSKFAQSNPQIVDGLSNQISTTKVQLHFFVPIMLSNNALTDAVAISVDPTSPVHASIATPVCNTALSDPVLSPHGICDFWDVGLVTDNTYDNILKLELFDARDEGQIRFLIDSSSKKFSIDIYKDAVSPIADANNAQRNDLTIGSFSLSSSERISQNKCFVNVTLTNVSTAPNLQNSSWKNCGVSLDVPNQLYTELVTLPQDFDGSKPHRIWYYVVDDAGNSSVIKSIDINGYASISSAVANGTSYADTSSEIVVDLVYAVPVSSMSSPSFEVASAGTGSATASSVFAVNQDSNGYASKFQINLSGVIQGSVEVILKNISYYTLFTSVKKLSIYKDTLPPLIKMGSIMRNDFVDKAKFSFQTNEVGILYICVLSLSQSVPTSGSSVASCNGGEKTTQQIASINTNIDIELNISSGNDDPSAKRVFCAMVDGRNNYTPIIYAASDLTNKYHVTGSPSDFLTNQELKPYNVYSDLKAINDLADTYTEKIEVRFRYPILLDNTSMVETGAAMFNSSWLCQDLVPETDGSCYVWQRDVDVAYNGVMTVGMSQSLLPLYDFRQNSQYGVLKSTVVKISGSKVSINFISYSRLNNGVDVQTKYKVSADTDVFIKCAYSDLETSILPNVVRPQNEAELISYGFIKDKVKGAYNVNDELTSSCSKGLDSDSQARKARFIHFVTISSTNNLTFSTLKIPEYLTFGNLLGQKFGPDVDVEGATPTLANVVPIGQKVVNYNTANQTVYHSTTHIRFGFSAVGEAADSVGVVYPPSITESQADKSNLLYFRFTPGSQNPAVLSAVGTGNNALSRAIDYPYNQTYGQYYQIGFNVISGGSIRLCMRVDNLVYMGLGEHYINSSDASLTNVAESCSNDIEVFKDSKPPQIVNPEAHHYSGSSGTKVRVSYLNIERGKYCYIVTDEPADHALSEDDDKDIDKLKSASSNCLDIDSDITNSYFNIEIPNHGTQFLPHKVWIFSIDEEGNWKLFSPIKLKAYLVYSRFFSMMNNGQTPVSDANAYQYMSKENTNYIRIAFAGLSVVSLSNYASSYDDIIDFTLLDGDNSTPLDTGKATKLSDLHTLSCDIDANNVSRLCMQVNTISQGRIGASIAIKSGFVNDFELGWLWSGDDEIANNSLVIPSSQLEKTFVGGFGQGHLNVNANSSVDPPVSAMDDDGYSEFSGWVFKDSLGPELTNVQVLRTDVSANSDPDLDYQKVDLKFETNSEGKVGYYFVPDTDVEPNNINDIPLNSWQFVNIDASQTNSVQTISLTNFPNYYATDICFVAIDSNQNASDIKCKKLKNWTKFLLASQIGGSSYSATSSGLKLEFSKPIILRSADLIIENDTGDCDYTNLYKNTNPSLGATDGTLWLADLVNVTEGKINVKIGYSQRYLEKYDVANYQINGVDIYAKSLDNIFTVNKVERVNLTTVNYNYSSSASKYDIYYEPEIDLYQPCSPLPANITFGQVQNQTNYQRLLNQTSTSGQVSMQIPDSYSSSLNMMAKFCTFTVDEYSHISNNSSITIRQIPHFLQIESLQQRSGEGTEFVVGGEKYSTDAVAVNLAKPLDLLSLRNSGLISLSLSDQVIDPTHTIKSNTDSSEVILRKSRQNWTQSLANAYHKNWGNGQNSVNESTPLCPIQIAQCEFWVLDNLKVTSSGYLNVLITSTSANINYNNNSNTSDVWVFSRDKSKWDNPDDVDCWKDGGSCKNPDDVPKPPGGGDWNDPENPHFNDCPKGGGCDTDGDGIPNINDPDSPNCYFESGGCVQNEDGIENKDNATNDACYLPGGSCQINPVKPEEDYTKPIIPIQKFATIYYYSQINHISSKSWNTFNSKNCPSSGCLISITVADISSHPSVYVKSDQIGYLTDYIYLTINGSISYENLKGHHKLIMQSNLGEKRVIEIYGPHVIYAEDNLEAMHSEVIDLPGSDKYQHDYGPLTDSQWGSNGINHPGPFRPNEEVCYSSVYGNLDTVQNWLNWGCVHADNFGNISLKIPANIPIGTYYVFAKGSTINAIVQYAINVVENYSITVEVKSGSGHIAYNGAIYNNGDKINILPDQKTFSMQVQTSSPNHVEAVIYDNKEEIITNVDPANPFGISKAFKLDNVSYKDHTLQLYFAGQSKHIIIAHVNNQKVGKITPGGIIEEYASCSIAEQNCFKSKEFKLEFNNGYYVANIYLNGVKVHDFYQSKYVLTSLTGFMNLYIEFLPNEYKEIKINYTGQGDYSMTESDLPLHYKECSPITHNCKDANVVINSRPKITFKPSDKWEIDEIKIDGKKINLTAAQKAGTSYQFGQIRENHTVEVLFTKMDLLTVLIQTVGHGKTSPKTSFDILRHNKQTIDFIPDAGYMVKSVMLDNKSIPTKDFVYTNTEPKYPIKYTISDVTENHLISVVFEPIRSCKKGFHWDDAKYQKNESISEACVMNTIPDKISITDADFSIAIKDHSRVEKGYEVQLNWKAPFDGGEPITNYYISIENVWGESVIKNHDNKTLTSYNHQNLQVGKYFVTIWSKNIVGESQKVTKEFLIELPIGSDPVFSDLKSFKNGSTNLKARYQDILWLAKTGVTIGANCPSVSKKRPCVYMPQNPVNRAAMADFMYKLIGQVERGVLTTQSKWFKKEKEMKTIKGMNIGRYNHILWLAKTGITRGCETNNGKASGTPIKYCPQYYVNRGAMAEFMYHLAGDPNSLNPKAFDASRPNQNHVDPKSVATQENLLKNDKYLKTLKTTLPNRYYDILWLVKYNISVPQTDPKTKKKVYLAQNPVNRGAMAQFMRKLYYVMLTAKPVPANGIVPDVIQ